MKQRKSAKGIFLPFLLNKKILIKSERQKLGITMQFFALPYDIIATNTEIH